MNEKAKKNFFSSLGYAIDPTIVDGSLCAKSANVFDPNKQNGLGVIPNAAGDFETFATDIQLSLQSQLHGYICESSGMYIHRFALCHSTTEITLKMSTDEWTCPEGYSMVLDTCVKLMMDLVEPMEAEQTCIDDAGHLLSTSSTLMVEKDLSLFTCDTDLISKPAEHCGRNDVCHSNKS